MEGCFQQIPPRKSRAQPTRQSASIDKRRPSVRQKEKAISWRANVVENEFFTRIRKLADAPRSSRVHLLRNVARTYTRTREHVHQHDRLHSRARLATSPALGSASICQFPVSNKMDGWRMEIMVETQPHTFASFHRVERETKKERECEREGAPPFCLRPPLYRESHHPRVIPRFDLVSSPFASFVL